MNYPVNENGRTISNTSFADMIAQAQVVTDIDNSIAGLQSSLSALSSSALVETSRAIASENSISAIIIAEASRAAFAETGIKASVVVETSRAKAAEVIVASAVNALQTINLGVVANITALQTSVTGISTAITALQASDAVMSTNITALQGSDSVMSAAIAALQAAPSSTATVQDTTLNGWFFGDAGNFGSQYERSTASLGVNIRCYRVGQIVTLKLYAALVPGNNAGKQAIYCQLLPDFVRPNLKIYQPLPIWTGNTMSPGYLHVMPSGQVRMELVGGAVWSGMAGLIYDTCVSYIVD